MKLIGHIVWKDLTRLRWWLVLWFVALALPILDGVELILHCPLPLPDGGWNRPNLHAGLVAIEIVTGYLIATLLWHEDRIPGTRQFWTTRPISGGRLLVAKLIGTVIVLWGIPVLVSLPWWAWCGFNFHQIAIAASETAALAALVGVPVAVVAALTDSLVRSLIWTAVLIASAVPLFFTTMRGVHDMPLLGSRVLLILSLLLVEMLVLTLARFVWRSRWWPVGAIAIVMIGSVWLARSTRWMWFDSPGVWRPERAANVGLDFDHATVKPSHSPEAKAVITTYFRLSVPPESAGIIPLLAVQRWIWSPDDHIMRPAGFGVQYALDIDGFHPIHRDSDPTHISAMTGPRSSESSAKRFADITVSMPIQTTTLDRIRRERPAYAASLMLAQVRLSIADECPLQPGHWTAHDGCGLQIRSINRSNDASALVLVSTHPIPMADTLMRWGWRGWLHGSFSRIIALVNHDTKEYQWVLANKPVTLRVNGVEIEWNSGAVNAGYVYRNGTWVPRTEWFEHASLAAVTANTESIFARDISVPKMVISGDTP